MSSTSSPQVGRLSTRVALTATGIVAVVYLVVALAIVAWVTVNLTAQVDARLDRALTLASLGGRPLDGARRDAGKPTEPNVLGPTDGVEPPIIPFGRERATWVITSDGSVTSARADLPLPTANHSATEQETIVIDESEIRIAGIATDEGHVVVGESMDPVNDARTTVIVGILLIAPFLLATVFLGSLLVGRRVAMPVERARLRQLAFTADASHELRTPLAVIEANASLALADERDPEWYRRSFERVLAESRRMHRLIDELLWLARFDATEKAADQGSVDLGVLLELAADRFASVAEAESLSLEVHIEAPGSTLSAPPEWIDQLIGVLLDNACKYSTSGGRVVARVSSADARLALTVDDSGPGIPEDQREHIFDRFHRASDEHAGAGLGLAIADAIVRATDGRWTVGTSPDGGARMSVSWAYSGTATAAEHPAA